MKLKLLLIEDSDDDAVLIEAELESAGYELDITRVFTRQAVQSALNACSNWDLIISDHNLPGFSSIDTLFILLKLELDIPFIIVSGTIGEEVAVEVMKSGAQDYVMKDHLSRLGPAVKNAIDAFQAKRCAQDYQQRLRELSMHIEMVREEERAAMARDIHDEIGGLLTALKMDVRWLGKQLGQSESDVEGKFDTMGSHLDEAIKSVRRIITDLRPSVLDDLGLSAALEWQLTEFCKRHNTQCQFVCAPEIMDNTPRKNDIAIFRIFQESLTNIAKHAKATEVVVRINRQDRRLVLEIIDNGVGISDENRFKKGSYGLIGMNERALAMGGQFQILANNEEGSRVLLTLPCQELDNNEGIGES